MHSARVRRAVISSLVLVAAVASCLLPVAPASATDGDVLTMELYTSTNSSGTSTTSAGFYTMGSGTGLGVTAQFSSGIGVMLAPPSGSLFSVGQTYPIASTATSTLALLTPRSVAFSSNDCLYAAGRYSGSIRVLDADYDNTGHLTVFAADYTASCTTLSGVVETMAGSVRHGSSRPWLALSSGYPIDTVAVGQQRSRTVTITAFGSGSSVTLGAAELKGRRSSDYAVTTDGCAGRSLAPGDSCTLAVRFAPLAMGNSDPIDRVAELAVPTQGHVPDTVRVWLGSRSTVLPSAPTRLRTFPTANGVGVAWSRSADGAQHYALSRRSAGETLWTPLTRVDENGTFTFVDSGVAAGATATYRVVADNAGWEGPAQDVEGTRLATVPTPTSRRALAVSYTGLTSTPSQVSYAIAASDPDSTVTVWGGNTPGTSATFAPPSPGTPRSVTFQMPYVPGPGTYRGDAAGSVSHGVGPTCDSDKVLVVRSVLYAADGVPLVMDASWTGRCPDGEVTRLESRIGSAAGVSDLATDPVAVRLTTFGNAAQPRTVAVTNSGSRPVTMGLASVRGAAASEWSVLTSGCSGVILAAGESCPVRVAFATSAAGSRASVLEVAAQDSDGVMAPALVPLLGTGATVPGETIGSATGAIGAVLLTLRPPDDGDLPITQYEVQRQDATHPWQGVAVLPASTRPTWVDRAVARQVDYSYRVRASNAVGPGAWSTSPGLDRVAPGQVGIIVSGREGAGGPRSLYLVTVGSADDPVVPLTADPQHDYRDAAVGLGGRRLAVSVGTPSGADYDIYTGTLQTPALHRLTTMIGSERDAAFSPDRSQVTFTHTLAGQSSVYSVASAGGEPRLLRTGAAHPAWAADGRSLVVADTSAPGAPLLRLDPATGAPLGTVPDSAGGAEPAIASDGTLAWTDPAGQILRLTPGMSSAVLWSGDADYQLGNAAFTSQGALLHDTTRRSDGTQLFGYNNLIQGILEQAPIREDADSPPQLRLTHPPDVVLGSATWSVSVSDDLTPVSELHAECRIDAGAWSPCSTLDSVSGLRDGYHSVTARVVDESGQQSTDAVGFSSDTRAPVTSVVAPTQAAALAGSLPFRWSASDATTRVAGFDVTVATSTPTRALGSFARPLGWSALDSRTSMALRPAPGTQTCVRVRSRDTAGNWSAYLTRCATRPLDDAALRASPGWRRSKGSVHYEGTETTSSRARASLSTTSVVSGRRLAVVATTCRGCGAVRVFVGGRLVGTVPLAASRTSYRQIRYLSTWTSSRTGVVRLQSTSRRPVHIDGLLISRS